MTTAVAFIMVTISSPVDLRYVSSSSTSLSLAGANSSVASCLRSCITSSLTTPAYTQTLAQCILHHHHQQPQSSSALSNRPAESLHFNSHFPAKPGLAGYTGAKDDGGGGDNWSRAPVKLSPPTNQHPTFYRPDALPVARPTASKALNSAGLNTDGINHKAATVSDGQMKTALTYFRLSCHKFGFSCNYLL